MNRETIGAQNLLQITELLSEHGIIVLKGEFISSDEINLKLLVAEPEKLPIAGSRA